MEDAKVKWVTGDVQRLPIPADADALRKGGAEWLTHVFRSAGTLDVDNRVVAVTRCEGFSGGGTGTKALLSVTYLTPAPGLYEDLFVKFSRNFDDPIMDRSKHHMQPEVRLALLSREPDFPVAVPACLFADFHQDSGTGLLITRRIPFGQDGIEPQYPKCLDHLMPDPLDHYRALITAAARLAGSHKGGRLPGSVAAQFPLNHAALLAADRNPYTSERMAGRVARYAQFAADYPQLLPAAIRTPAFLASLDEGAALFLAHEDAIKAFLHARPEFIALCHWNANADNAWFWHEAGTLHCGLMDWGSVGQMHIAMTLWGCLSGAEGWLWARHLDELLALFIAEFTAAGGPPLDPAELKVHLKLYVAMMGLAWLMDAPPRILRELPDLANCTDPRDPRFTGSETGRVQLQMMTNFLALWQASDLTDLLRQRFAARSDT